MKQLQKILIEVRNYLAVPAHWIRFMQYDDEGRCTEPSYCLYGAILAADAGILGKNGERRYRKGTRWGHMPKRRAAALKVAKEMGFARITELTRWNNSSSHEEVLSLIDAAIAGGES